MNDDELRPSHRAVNDEDETADGGGGFAGAVAGCLLMVVLLIILALAMWLCWPGGDKP